MTQKTTPDAPVPTPPPAPAAAPAPALTADDRRKRNIPVAVDRRRQNAAEKRRTPSASGTRLLTVRFGWAL